MQKKNPIVLPSSISTSSGHPASPDAARRSPPAAPLLLRAATRAALRSPAGQRGRLLRPFARRRLRPPATSRAALLPAPTRAPLASPARRLRPPAASRAALLPAPTHAVMRLRRHRRGARGRGGGSPAHRPPEPCLPGRRSRAGCSCRPPREQVSTPAATPAVFSRHPRGYGVVWPRAGPADGNERRSIAGSGCRRREREEGARPRRRSAQGTEIGRAHV